MSRQNNRNPERERKNEEPKRDAASHTLRFSSNHEPRRNDERDRDVRNINLSRNYLNDLYERSSI